MNKNIKADLKEQILPNDKQTQLLEKLIIPPFSRTKNDLLSIAQSLDRVVFFEKFREKPEFIYICQHLTLETFQYGEILFQQEDQANKFYLILEGNIGLYIKRKECKDNQLFRNQVNFEAVQEIAQLHDGQAFGELGLLYNVKRTATAVSLGLLRVAVLEKYIFQKYFKGLQNEQLTLMIEFFQGMWMLRSFPFERLLKFATKSTITKCTTKSLIIKQGEIPKGIFFIRSGLAQIIRTIVLRDGRSKIIQLDELGKGNSLCARELLTESKMTHSVLASTSLELILINIDSIEEYFTESDKQNLLDETDLYPDNETLSDLYSNHQVWQTKKIRIFNNSPERSSPTLLSQRAIDRSSPTSSTKILKRSNTKTELPPLASSPAKVVSFSKFLPPILKQESHLLQMNRVLNLESRGNLSKRVSSVHQM